jgi:threonine/homoserine/homoserine lactone efflux protein
MSSLPAFLIAVAAILISPGPTNTLLSTSGALVGLRRSLPLIVMEMAGYLLAIFLVCRFLRPIIDKTGYFALGLRVVFSLYLVLLAYRLWHERIKEVEYSARIVSGTKVFVTTLLNPKAFIFAFAVFPPFADMMQFGAYGAAFLLISLPISIAWIAVGSSIGRFLTDEVRVLLPRLSATVLVVFAVVTMASSLLAFDSGP